VRIGRWISLALLWVLLAGAGLHAQETGQPAKDKKKAASARSVHKNLLLAANGGKVVSVTSELDAPGWHAENLIDGTVFNPKQEGTTPGWSSKTADFPQDIVFAFKDEETHLIHRVVINPQTANWSILGRGAKDVEILVSTTTKNGPYRSVATHSLLNAGEYQTISFKPVECKYLKLRILSNWGSDRAVSLGEVQAYEASMGKGELDEMISRLEQLLRDLKRYRDEMEGK